jgi:hypothetical protein
MPNRTPDIHEESAACLPPAFCWFQSSSTLRLWRRRRLKKIGRISLNYMRLPLTAVSRCVACIESAFIPITITFLFWWWEIRRKFKFLEDTVVWIYEEAVNWNNRIENSFASRVATSGHFPKHYFGTRTKRDIYALSLFCTRAQLKHLLLALIWARGSVVGWGTMLQAGRSRVRVLMSLIFEIYLIFPAALWPGIDFTSDRNEYQEYSWGVEDDRRVRLTNLPPSLSRLSR